MNKKLRGSYTVEAAFVMAIVLWSMIMAVQAAYYLRDEMVGTMALHEAVERLRHSETEDPKDIIETCKRRAGTPFSWKEYQIQLEETGNKITGKKVNASGKGGNWRLEIESSVFDPENFLRLLTLLKQGE